MDDLVRLIVMWGILLFCSRKRRIVLDWSRASDPRLIFNGVEELVDGELEWSEVLYRLEGLERIRWKNRERLSLVGGLPPIRVLGSGSRFILRLWLSPSSPCLAEWLASSSLLPPTGYMADLRTELHSSEWHRASVGVCKRGEKLAACWWMRV